MNDLQIFKNPEFGEIRTVVIDGEPWFVGKDVAAALGYSDVNKAVMMHVFDEDKKLNDKTSLSFGQRGATLINESGLYSLVLSSKLESAKCFKRWVTSEVLPSIRKHGMYAKEELLSDPDLLISVAQELKKEREQRKVLEGEVERMRPKAVFADAVAVSNDAILIGELAKIIKQNGREIGQNRLFEWMRQNGYLIRRNGADYNLPTQRAMEMKLFRIKERAFSNPDGSVRITRTVLVTGRGQQYFVNKFVETGQMSFPLEEMPDEGDE